jgi:predicted transcriptional regulator
MAPKLIRQRRESKSEREILDVLFSAVRAAMLRALFSSPAKERYVRELVRITGFALGTIQDELRMLSAVGLVTSWSNRYRRFYRANGENPLSSQLFQIVELSGRLPRAKIFGPRRKRHSSRSQLKAPALRQERALNWHLFSTDQKNLTG